MDKELKNIFDKFISDKTKEMRGILKQKGKGNTNIAKMSSYFTIKYKKTKDGDLIELESTLPDYAVFVHEGRKRGKQPPLKDIRAWLRKKGLKKELAFPIAKKIGERGLKGTDFAKGLTNLTELMSEITEKYKDDILNEINKLKK